MGSAEIVALKFIPKRGRTQKDLSLLQREIDIMSKLRHPNIILMQASFETVDQVRFYIFVCRDQCMMTRAIIL